MQPVAPPVVLAGRAAPMDGYLYGSHCYVVTQSGARRLLAHALPIEVHLDSYLSLVCHHHGVRGYRLQRSFVFQCANKWNAAIPHRQWREDNIKRLLPDVSILTAIRFVVSIVVVLVVVVSYGVYRWSVRTTG